MGLSKRSRAGPAAFSAVGLVALALFVPTAFGGSAPSIAWSPTTSAGTFDYGAVDVGQTVSQTFTLTNSGGSATAALKVSLSGSPAFSITSDGCTWTSLGKKKSCVVIVEYAPATAGQTDVATLTATGKKAAASTSITLTGSGAGAPDLSLSPGTPVGTTATGTKLYTFQLGACVCGPTTQTFMVTNNGTGATSTLVIASCCSPQFYWANDTCTGVTLAPNETCLFELTFNGGCNPGDEFHTPLDILGSPVPVTYIHLDADVFC
jgi:hypothetical protein